MSRGDPVLIQARGDRREGSTARALAENPLDNPIVKRWRAAQRDALLPFDSERVGRALPDDLALPLGDRHQHVRHQLPLGRREVEPEVERSDVPAALDRLPQQGCEVDHPEDADLGAGVRVLRRLPERPAASRVGFERRIDGRD